MLTVAIRFLLVIAILILVLAAALPSLVSSSWGREMALEIINSSIPGKILVEQLELGWLGPQKISGFTLKDPAGQTVLTAAKGEADASLLTLFRSPLGANQIAIEQLNATIQVDQQGFSNLEKSLKRSCCSPELSATTQPPLTLLLQQVNGHINLARDDQPLEIQLEGESSYNGQLGKMAFHLKLDKQVFEKILEQHNDLSAVFANNGSSAMVAHAQIDRFPVALIDQFLNLSDASQSGRAVALLGETLNFTLDQTLEQKNVVLNFALSSSALQLKGNLQIADDLSSAHLVGQGSMKGEAIDLEVQAQLPKGILTNRNAFQQEPMALEASLKQFPLKLFLPQEGFTPTLLAVVGQYVDINSSFVSHRDKLNGKLTLSSEQLAPATVLFEIADRVRLTEPFKIIFPLTPLVAQGGPLFTPALALQQGAHFQLALDTLEAPLSYKRLMSGDLDFPLSDLEYTGSIATTPLAFVANAQIGSFTVDQINGTFTAKKGSQPEITFGGLVEQTDAQGALKRLLGERTALQATLTGQVLSADFEEPLQLTLGLSSPLAFVDMVSQISSSGIQLTKPARVRYQVEPPALQFLGLQNLLGAFQMPTSLEVSIHSWQLPANLKELSKLHMRGGLTIDTLASAGRQAALDAIKAQWIIDGSNRVFAIDFYGVTRFGKEAAGQLSGSVILEDWIQEERLDFDRATLRTNLDAHRLPTELVAFNYGGSDVAQIIGHALDMKLAAKMNDLQHPKGHATLTMQSDRLSGYISVAIDDAISLTKQMDPASFQFKLTPEGHAALRNLLKRGFENPFNLNETATLSVSLNTLHIPLPFSLAQAAVDAIIGINKLSGTDQRSQQRLWLSDISAEVVSPNLSNQIDFRLKGHGYASQGQATDIQVSGAVHHLLDPSGQLNLNGLSLALDGSAEALPAPLLCKLFCTDTQLSHQTEALFGQLVNAKIKAQLQHMNGPVTLQATGANGSFTLNGMLSDGYLFLNDNLTAHVKLTPNFSHFILQELVPITNGIIPTNQPLNLIIDKRGFALPINPFAVETLSIGMLSIDIGQVQFSSNSQLASALSLLTPANAESIKVWITPVYLSMKEGVVRIERTDMLINERYPLATWGHVDLIKERVNMIVGLSGAALASAFNIKSIPRSYLLQMPFKGPLDNPTLDKTRAAGRISALTAQAHGGPEGLVIGTVLDILSGGTKEASPPQPTTDPLPWQNMMVDTEESSSGIPKSPLKAPMDEITKGASSLLKTLLNKKKK